MKPRLTGLPAGTGGPVPPGVLRRARGRPLRGRRQMRTRRRWTWRSLLHAPIPQLVALLVVLGGLYGLATSRVFSIAAVQVAGTSGPPAAPFRRFCGCVGANIFLARPAEVRARLARHLPWLDVRQVYARLPDRIVVEAAYRRPILLWRTTVATYTVGLDGTVLYDVHRPPVPRSLVPTTATVPLVYSPHDAILAAGGHVPTVAVQMVLATRKGLAPDLAPSVDKYRWSPYSGLTAHSRIGWWFSLGIVLGDTLQSRLNALEDAHRRHYMKQGHCNYVDLRPVPNVYCDYELQWHWPLGPGTR